MLISHAHNSLADFRLVTQSFVVPLIIPPAFPLTHLPGLCSLMPGSSSLCTCSAHLQEQEKVCVRCKSASQQQKCNSPVRSTKSLGCYRIIGP